MPGKNQQHHSWFESPKYWYSRLKKKTTDKENIYKRQFPRSGCLNLGKTKFGCWFIHMAEQTLVDPSTALNWDGLDALGEEIWDSLSWAFMVCHSQTTQQSLLSLLHVQPKLGKSWNWSHFSSLSPGHQHSRGCWILGKRDQTPGGIKHHKGGSNTTKATDKMLIREKQSTT